MNLSTEITYLKGVGEIRSALFKRELNISTVEDILYHFPLRYVDRTRILQIKDLKNDLSKVQLKGTIGHIQKGGNPRKPFLKVRIIFLF